MSKNLVLVESPSKAKTINRYLGSTYIVEATIGHLKNLPKTKLGIDIENGFEPKFLNIRGKGEIINKIRKLASKSNKIFIATDPDREGEAIAQDIYDIVEGKTQAHIYRVLFNEITKNSVKAAMKVPLEINSNLVVSQRARRVMDRIIGYKISPLLWRVVLEASGSSLSAGRVQSVALRLICEREEEIEKFIPTEFWNITADFKDNKNNVINAKLAEISGRQIKLQPKPEMTEDEWREFNKNNIALNNEFTASTVIDEIEKNKNFKISEITKKTLKRNPAPPFITSTLQAEASRKLGFRPRKTMQIAQSLYEGVKLGKEGFVGMITYMRTDSTRLNEESVARAREFVETNLGAKYIPAKVRSYVKAGKNIQDAHEAIRPTDVIHTPDKVKQFLTSDQFKLYELIWKRMVASQMSSAILESTSISISNNIHLFKASGTVIIFDGFKKLYEETTDEINGSDDDKEKILPKSISKGEKLSLEDLMKIQSFTKPPPRFTESTLIKELENNGIGRPSTYASIIGTIQDRNYISFNDKKLQPTGIGKKVNSVLVEYFPEILNVNFTAQMEGELDLIANGEIEYDRVLKDFYTPFSDALKYVEEKIEKVICEKCGSEMELKIGRFGKYLACTNYPECSNIVSLKGFGNSNSEPEFTGEICPECGGKTIFRSSKFGKFIGCENYPKCSFTQSVTTGIKCPKCNIGDIVSRRSKKGRFFYGCSNYPKCDYVTWKLPDKNSDDSDSE